MINSTFYILSILFILNELYYISNRMTLDAKFKERELGSFSKIDVIYYLTRVISWVWIVLGCFSSYNMYFYILVSMSLIRLIIYPISKKSYYIYDRLCPFISIFVMSYIFYRFVIG